MYFQLPLQLGNSFMSSKPHEREESVQVGRVTKGSRDLNARISHLLTLTLDMSEPKVKLKTGYKRGIWSYSENMVQILHR